MAQWRDLDDAVRVKPGSKPRLKDPVRDDLLPDRKAAEKQLAADAEAINHLQDALFAEGRRALLVVLQGIDTAGKDGTVRAVFNATGPLGVTVHPFGRPSPEELAHDYLWRAHKAAPARGFIGIFNRSHYEDVLVVKVRGLAPAEEVERRYDQINAFERHLSENGVTLLKCMLHISKAEQAERLQQRLDDPEKRWKWNAADLDDRKLWASYEKAYETMLARCSTEWAPWRVIPSDRKWRRNAIVARLVRGVLEDMAPAYPSFDWSPSDFKIE